MGNLLLDASSPAGVVSSGTTATTASFTPPAGSRLVISFGGNNSTGSSPTAPTTADNRGAPLTYSVVQHSARPDTPVTEGQASLITAVVTTSVAMTVTVTNTNTGGLAIKVMVFTDDGGGTPAIGTSKKGASNTSTSLISDSYTATAAGSRGVIAYYDWDARSPAPTAGTNTTLTGGYSLSDAATGTYGFALTASANGVVGGSQALNLTVNTASKNHWAIVEITPAASAAAVMWPRRRGPNYRR